MPTASVARGAGSGLASLVVGLARPYRTWLAIILAAMLVETLLVVAITPFLLLFVARFKKAVKKATREVRRRQGDVLAVLQAGLESVRTTQAFGAQDVEAARLGEASRATVSAALGARRVKSLLSPVVAVVVAVCTALVMWRGAELVIGGVMTVGSLTVFLAYLARFFKPVQDLGPSWRRSQAPRGRCASRCSCSRIPR